MFEYLRWPHGIELVQHLESAELDRFGTLRVTAELEGFILRLLSIEKKYESLYVAYPQERHTNFHDILFYWHAVAKLAVDNAIS